MWSVQILADALWKISDKTAQLSTISKENEKVVDTLNQTTCELEELVKLFKV